ncbi:MAG: hypothetical protein LBM73_00830 [Candidatus Nomurabacteria bacterium]|jgi:hypothetical protein|nr:hypothetical protein [Candidatus Nomurabacteria bacterium]
MKFKAELGSAIHRAEQLDYMCEAFKDDDSDSHQRALAATVCANCENCLCPRYDMTDLADFEKPDKGGFMRNYTEEAPADCPIRAALGLK